MGEQMSAPLSEQQQGQDCFTAAQPPLPRYSMRRQPGGRNLPEGAPAGGAAFWIMPRSRYCGSWQMSVRVARGRQQCVSGRKAWEASRTACLLHVLRLLAGV